MNTKNLKIYKTNNRKKKISNIRKRTITLTTAAIILLTGIFIGKSKSDSESLDNNIKIILNNYSEDSDEVRIVKYLQILLELKELDLDKYAVSEELMSRVNSDPKIFSPESIKSAIEDFKLMPNPIETNIDSEYNFATRVLFLKGQEAKIENYIINDSFNNVYNSFVSNLKKYTSEKFGLENPKKVELFKSFIDPSHKIKREIIYDDNFIGFTDDKTICDGIEFMIGLQSLKAQLNKKSQYSKEDYINMLNEYSSVLVEALKYGNIEDEIFYNM